MLNIIRPNLMNLKFQMFTHNTPTVFTLLTDANNLLCTVPALTGIKWWKAQRFIP